MVTVNSINHCLDNGNGDGNFKWFIIFDNCVLDDDCSDEFVLVNFRWLRIDEQWFIADNDRQSCGKSNAINCHKPSQ